MECAAAVLAALCWRRGPRAPPLCWLFETLPQLWHSPPSLQVGEGLEAEAKDFAAEVAELAGQ